MAEPSADPPRVLLQDGARLLEFRRPASVLEARDAADVVPRLHEADRAIAGGGWVAGFLAYEAARAFALPTRPPAPDGPPLLWLGVFEPPGEVGWPRAGIADPPGTRWRPALDAAAHARSVARIGARIAAGDTYQANLTFPIAGPLEEEPLALFARLVGVQRPRHAAFLDLGRFAVASASPELFFRVRDGIVETRPMKGTAPRGRTAAEDRARAALLRASEKERAENLMIVDMLRNDLGRVAAVGSVEVASLFDVEAYPTLLQMTSTVRARVAGVPLSRLLAALFPCASVTGAPRVRTMQILASEEVAPRGVYTGAIGWAAPDGRSSWSVAIRTAVADRERGLVVYGVGSGIVADSTAEQEYAECLLKAEILEAPPFAIVETFAFLPGEGFRHLDRHLARLAGSADHFGFPMDGRRVHRALAEAAAGLASAARVRLLLHADGDAEVQTEPLAPAGTDPLRVGLAARAVDPGSPWLYHKTTRRRVYEEARASRPDCDEVLLWNERGEVTECSTANVVVEAGGVRLTPPVSCGLLPGVERARVLAEGRAVEAVVGRADLRQGQRLWLASSLRGVREGIFVG